MKNLMMNGMLTLLYAIARVDDYMTMSEYADHKIKNIFMHNFDSFKRLSRRNNTTIIKRAHTEYIHAMKKRIFLISFQRRVKFKSIKYATKERHKI